MVNLNPLDWFKGHDKKELKEMGRVLAINQAKNRSEIEHQQILGIKQDLLKDETLLKFFDLLSYRYGETINEDGTKHLAPVGLDQTGLALRALTSPINRVGFYDERDARLMMIDVELAILRIGADTPLDDYTLEYHNRLSAIEMLAKAGILDSVKGRKAQLLNTIEQRTTVEVGEKEKKKGLF